MFKFGKNSIKNMQGVDPQAIFVFTEALRHSPIDFGIPQDGGVRTAERQQEMYLDPDIKTKADGYQNISRHQIPAGKLYGQALDVFAYLNGRASWTKTHLSMIAGVILSTNARLVADGKSDLEITWGGTFGSDDFGGWDMPHFQFKRFR